MNGGRQMDVAIIGAGFAGLTAALELTRAGISAVVLEARDRVGGRTLNRELDDGKSIEVGGQWIGPGQDRMYRLAKDLGVEVYPTHDSGDTVAIIGGKKRRFSGDLPRLNPVVTADFAQAFLRLERLAKKVPLEEPWTAQFAERMDGKTMETWILRNVRTDTARSILRLFVGAVFATEPATLSLLHALFYIRSGHSFDRLIRTGGGAQQDRVAGGSQILAIKLAEQLRDRVLLSSPVRRIEVRSWGVRVLSDGDALEAKRVVVCIPPALSARIAYDPPLPGYRDQLTQRMPQGSVVKAYCIYEEPFWRKEGLNGQAGGSDALVGITFDNSLPDDERGILVGLIEGKHARHFGRLPEEARRKEIIDGFTSYFGPPASHPTDCFYLDWSEEEWTRGCYGAHLPPGVLTQYGPALREPVGRIHWAGTETATEWAGYMEGAVQSGERVAAEVISLLG